MRVRGRVREAAGSRTAFSEDARERWAQPLNRRGLGYNPRSRASLLSAARSVAGRIFA
jgi:hypothetical protein